MLALLIACSHPAHHGPGRDSASDSDAEQVEDSAVGPPLPVTIDAASADAMWVDSNNDAAPDAIAFLAGTEPTLLALKSFSWGDRTRPIRFLPFGEHGWDPADAAAEFSTSPDFVWSSWDEVASVGGPNPGLLVGARENGDLTKAGGTLFFFPADSSGSNNLTVWAWRWDGAVENERLGEKLGWVGDPVGDERSYVAAAAKFDAACDAGCMSVVLLAIDEPGLAPESAPVRIDPVSYPSAEEYAGTSFVGADVNGDGVGDLVIGNRMGNTGDDDAGWVATFEGPIPLGTWRPSDYTRRWHRTDYYAWFGDKVVNAGDVTGDGLDDLVATSWDWASAGAGPDMYGLPKHAYLIPGGAESGEVSYAAVAEFVEAETGRVQETRLELAVPGDVDGDSVPDILLGSSDLSGPDPGNLDHRGSVWLFSGTSRGTTELTWYADGEVFVGGPGEELHLVTGGDIDGNGLADLVLGSDGLADDGTVGTLYTFLAPI